MGVCLKFPFTVLLNQEDVRTVELLVLVMRKQT
jgi:hypothetical protein